MKARRQRMKDTMDTNDLDPSPRRTPRENTWVSLLSIWYRVIESKARNAGVDLEGGCCDGNCGGEWSFIIAALVLKASKDGI